ncbi:MAG: hypothetical protein HFE90_09740 [Firmicutes bacterium]|nr:hypothetical protein [Bacillota bacterium]
MGIKTVKNSKAKKKRNLIKLIIPIYFIILIALIIIVYAYPKMSGVLSKTMIVEYGNLQIANELECYIVKDETVYFAGESGNVKYNYSEGDMARSGASVLLIEPSADKDNNNYDKYNKKVRSFLGGNSLLSPSAGLDEAITELQSLYENSSEETEKSILNFQIQKLSGLGESKENGQGQEKDGEDNTSVDQVGVSGTYSIDKSSIISYCLDGYESEFSPYTMQFLDKNKVSAIDTDNTDVSSGTATKGEPVFKSVDARVWYAVAWIKDSELGKYEKDKAISMKLPGGSVSGSIQNVIDNGKDIMIIMAFNSYYQDLASLRKITTEIVTSDYRGLIIDNSFIASKDGVPGVYVVNVTGEAEFTPIKVKTTDGKFSLVESGYYTETIDGELKQIKTVQVYDEIRKID